METLLQSDFDDIQTARKHRRDRFAYEKFTEQSAPDMAVQARKVHAEGYHSMGFVHESALAEDGTLSGDIDKARGALVEYYAGIDLAHQEENEGVVVTLRKVGIPEGGTIADLPAYKLCADTLYEDEKERLWEIQDADERVKEIGALARTAESNPIATLELLRNVHQESLGTGEIWFFSIVNSTYKALEDNFGNVAIRQIGAGVKFDDERVGEKVELVPAIVDVDNLLDNMIKVLEDEENHAHRNRIFRTIMFFSDGLSDTEMSADVKSLREAYARRAEGSAA